MQLRRGGIAHHRARRLAAAISARDYRARAAQYHTHTHGPYMAPPLKPRATVNIPIPSDGYVQQGVEDACAIFLSP